MLVTSEVTKQALSISIKEVLDECVERRDGGGWQMVLGADNFVVSFWEVGCPWTMGMEANPHLGASENFTLMLSTKARQGRQRKLRPNGQDGPLVQSSYLSVKSSDFLQNFPDCFTYRRNANNHVQSLFTCTLMSDNRCSVPLSWH